MRVRDTKGIEMPDVAMRIQFNCFLLIWKSSEAMFSPSILAKGHARTDSAASAESQAPSSSPRSSSWLGSTKTFFSRTSSLPVVEKPVSDDSSPSPRRWSFGFSAHGEKEPKEPSIVRSRKYTYYTRMLS